MNKQRLYAVVDIETTGSFAGNSKMTEIAIILHNGKKVVERYHSLINPEQPIPYQIQVLTGISPEMVASAPTFAEIAEDVYHFLSGKLFVAHNVNFDYSFLVKELKEAGYDWHGPKLCTVRLARKLLPGHASYSLGKLCHSLDIPLQDRHRASGDAEATVLLLERLIAADTDYFIHKSITQNTQSRLPTHISIEQYQRLPETTGIYYFKNNKGKVIYIGKALNIKSRVLAHFTGNNSSLKRQQLINEIGEISFQESGSELMALLMECQEIKKYWPIHNKALKKYDPKYALLHYEDTRGYARLAVCKVAHHVQAIQYFETAHHANQSLLAMMESASLTPSLCTFYSPSTTSKEDRQQPKVALPTVTAHNDAVFAALADYQSRKRSFLYIDQGRHDEEQSYIYFKDNKLFAFGFIEHIQECHAIEDIVAYKDKCSSNYYMQELLLQYAERFPQNVKPIPQPVEESFSE